MKHETKIIIINFEARIPSPKVCPALPVIKITGRLT
jgi:hypothetical protein